MEDTNSGNTQWSEEKVREWKDAHPDIAPLIDCAINPVLDDNVGKLNLVTDVSHVAHILNDPGTKDRYCITFYNDARVPDSPCILKDEVVNRVDQVLREHPEYSRDYATLLVIDSIGPWDCCDYSTVKVGALLVQRKFLPYYSQDNGISFNPGSHFIDTLTDKLNDTEGVLTLTKELFASMKTESLGGVYGVQVKFAPQSNAVKVKSVTVKRTYSFDE